MSIKRVLGAIGVMLVIGSLYSSCKSRQVADSEAKGGVVAIEETPINSEKDLQDWLERKDFLTSSNAGYDTTEIVENFKRSLIPNANRKELREAIERLINFYEYVDAYKTWIVNPKAGEPGEADSIVSPFSFAHVDQSGKALSNADYLKAFEKAIPIPTWLNDTEFLKNITKDGSKDEAIRSKVAAANSTEKRQGKNQILFIRFANNPRLGSGDPADKNDSADRSFFYIPAYGEKKIAYGIMFSGEAIVSVIAIESSTGKPQTYYADHIWSKADGIKQHPNPPNNSCLICHKSGGFFAIYPDMSKKHDAQSLANIKILNSFVENLGVAHHGVYDQIEKKKLNPNFPALDSKDLDSEYIKKLLAAKKTFIPPEVNEEKFLAKVDELEACSECHTDDHSKTAPLGYKVRAALRPPMFSLAMVRQGLMPPENKFDAAEADLYAQILEADYREKIINYFVGSAATAKP